MVHGSIKGHGFLRFDETFTNVKVYIYFLHKNGVLYWWLSF